MLTAILKPFTAERAEFAEDTRKRGFLISSVSGAQSAVHLAVLTLSLALFLPSVQASAYGRLPSQAQDSAKTLIAVKVKGTKRFKEEEVIAASGLQLGRTVGEDDFKKAARTLGDTGAFTDIGYSYSYSAAGTKLDLQVTDALKFLPTHFEDFVWFSDDELEKAIKTHVPLYKGELPSFGRLADEVSDALQTLLVQSGIPGHVDYLRTSGPSGQMEAFDYKVSDVLIRIRNIAFSGAGPSELPLLQAAAQRLGDREYSRTRIDTFVERQLLPALHARGFLKASFGSPQPKVVKQAAAEAGSESSDETRSRTIVDVTLAVSSGQQYKLSRVEWSGNREFSTEQLQAMIHLKPGEPANSVQLADNLTAVRDLYGSRGYVNSAIKIDAQLDDAASMAVLRVEVKEDYVYRMGELEFRGLDNSLTAKLREAWKLRPGDVYDANYLNQYLPQANKLLPASLDWEVASHVTANVRDKTVDVDLQYSVKAPK